MTTFTTTPITTSLSTMKIDNSNIVEVKAPATLEEDYVFWATTIATSDGASVPHSFVSPSSSSDSSITFPVRVPPGGVVEGETIQVLLSTAQADILSSSSDCTNDCSSVTNRSSCHSDDDESPPLLPSQKDALRGEWKDCICSCLRLGVCHPHLWNACCCPSVLIGQILVRMKMTWLAHKITDPNKPETTGESPKKSTWKKFAMLIYIITIFVLSHAMYNCGSFIYQKNGGSIITKEDSYVQNDDYNIFQYNDDSTCYYYYYWWHRLCDLGLSFFLSTWGLFVVVRLRRAVRERYDIPPLTVLVSCPFRSFSLSLGRYEDFFCAFCCSCCTISQIARQTADYEGTEPASCCTLNGLRSTDNPRSASNKDTDSDDDDSSTSNGWCFQRLRQSLPSWNYDSIKEYSSLNDMV